MSKKASKFNSILAFIHEDAGTTGPSVSVTPTIDSFAASSAPDSFTSLSELLKYKNGQDVGETKNRILGVPLQNILDELVTSYLHTKDLQARFKDAAKNPVYKEKPELDPVFQRLNQAVVTMQAQIKAIAQDLDNLALDS